MSGIEERDEERDPGHGGVTVDHDGDRVAVRMWGEHDLTTVGLLDTALGEAIDADGHDVVVDLSDVVFMDGSTVGGLVQGRALLNARGRQLIVRSPSRNQLRLLQVCDLVDLVEPATAGTSRAPAAATPLATWVAVPKEPRQQRAAPAGSPPVPKDPERTRR